MVHLVVFVVVSQGNQRALLALFGSLVQIVGVSHVQQRRAVRMAAVHEALFVMAVFTVINEEIFNACVN
jgi:hypothetical protein